jgi:hypothetical protein
MKNQKTVCETCAESITLPRKLYNSAKNYIMTTVYNVESEFHISSFVAPGRM